MVAFNLDQYTWIVVVSGIFAFAAAFGIGSNDMANSFCTTVGSKALTVGQVVVVAAIMEFSGAMLLGASVTATIKSGVVQLSAFTASPAVFMFGFMCVLIAAAFWDNTATHFGLPVSTTHTTVGATVGMTIALRGFNAVVWSQSKTEFPYVAGMVPIFMSWIISPLLSGIITTIFFITLRTLVLRRENSLRNAMVALPIMLGGTIWLVVSFIIQTGNKNKTWTNRGDNWAIWVGAVCGVGCAIIFSVTILPFLVRKIHAQQEARDSAKADAELAGEEHVEAEEQTWFTKNVTAKIPSVIKDNVVSRTLFHGVNQDIHKIERSDRVMAIAEHAEKFDPKTEALFRYLQVFSACVMSFAHGANDVANAMGPFSAVYSIYDSGKLAKNSPVQTWILAYGGFGIVCGLAIFGYKILRVLGVDAVKLSNSRGFCAELATAVTVVMASRVGLPVSTTQVITGALFAIGLIEGAKGVNWRVFLKIVLGWVATLFVAAAVAAAFTSFGAYSPSKIQSDQIYSASKALNGTNTKMLAQLYAAPDFNATAWEALNSTFYKQWKYTVRDINVLTNVTAKILKEYNSTLITA